MDSNDFWQLGKYVIMITGGIIFYLELEKIKDLLTLLWLK